MKEFVRRKLRVVLLVDDHPQTLNAWQKDIKYFFSSRTRTLAAPDRATALSFARSEQPDLAIVDQHLGDSLGTELLPELRGCAPAVLAILTSADPTREDARRAGHEALLVIPKPPTWRPYLNAIEAGDDLQLIPEEPAMLSLEAIKAAHVSRVLRAHDNNVTATARVLDVSRSGLQRMLVKYGFTSGRSELARAIEGGDH